jgi:hypothetical protein
MKGKIVAEPTNAGIVVYRITGGDEKSLKCLPRQNLNITLCDPRLLASHHVCCALKFSF